MEHSKSQIRQQWRHWPSPVGKEGVSSWIISRDTETEIVRVCDIGDSKIGLLTRDGHLLVGEIGLEGKTNI